MRKFANYASLALVLLTAACKKDDNNGTTTVATETLLTGNISSQTLTADKKIPAARHGSSRRWPDPDHPAGLP